MGELLALVGFSFVASVTPGPNNVLQWLNPKAWIFALGAITTFRPVAMPLALGSVLVTLVTMAVIVPSATIWAVGGGVLGRVARDEGARRTLAAVMAILVLATVVSVWI